MYQKLDEIIQNLRRTFYPGQGQSQEAFKGLKVELRAAVMGVEMGFPTQPVDCNQNLKMEGTKVDTHVYTHLNTHENVPALQHSDQVKTTFAPIILK